MEKTSQKDKQLDDAKLLMWDCGSSLYDSFELKAFEKQLSSAISSRTLSMPHLSDRRLQPLDHQPFNKKSSRISRSLQKLLKSVFKPKQSNNTMSPVQEKSQERFYAVHDTSGALTTIPETPEFDGLSPEIRSLVRRTASDRFSATSVGISCA